MSQFELFFGLIYAGTSGFREHALYDFNCLCCLVWSAPGWGWPTFRNVFSTWIFWDKNQFIKTINFNLSSFLQNLIHDWRFSLINYLYQSVDNFKRYFRLNSNLCEWLHIYIDVWYVLINKYIFQFNTSRIISSSLQPSIFSHCSFLQIQILHHRSPSFVWKIYDHFLKYDRINMTPLSYKWSSMGICRGLENVVHFVKHDVTFFFFYKIY